MNNVLLSLVQATADQPIKVHHGWNASWWVWIVLAFIVLAIILSFSGRSGPRTRV
jgi:hypothetical protein